MALFDKVIKAPQISLTCPACSHIQPEPKTVLSTFCRECGEHYKVDHGNVIPSRILSPHRRKVLAPKPIQSDDLPQPQERNAAQKVVASLPSFIQQTKLSGISHDGEKRDVTCFDCDSHHTIPVEASSTNCPKCGSYISLRDFDIREAWSNQIKTRGDVVVHKRGSVNGVSTKCHNLTIHGEFTGGVDCSGNLTITRHGRIMGRVRCKKLFVSKKARVEFANIVFCDEADIDGTVSGSLICKGRVDLAQKATLEGDVAVGSLNFSEGARHSGQISNYNAEKHAPKDWTV